MTRGRTYTYFMHTLQYTWSSARVLRTSVWSSTTTVSTSVSARNESCRLGYNNKRTEGRRMQSSDGSVPVQTMTEAVVTTQAAA